MSRMRSWGVTGRGDGRSPMVESLERQDHASAATRAWHKDNNSQARAGASPKKRKGKRGKQKKK